MRVKMTKMQITKIRELAPDARIKDLGTGIYNIRGVSAEIMHQVHIFQRFIESENKERITVMSEIPVPENNFASLILTAMNGLEADLNRRVKESTVRIEKVTMKFEQEAKVKLAGIEEKVLARQNAQDVRIGKLEHENLTLRNSLAAMGQQLVDAVKKAQK